MSEAGGLHSSKTPKEIRGSTESHCAQVSKGSRMHSSTYQRTEVWVGKDVAVVGVQEGVAMDTQLEKEALE